MVRTSSITVPSMVRIVGRAPAVDEKVFFVCLFVCLSRFGIWFVVVHLYSTFSVDPQNFSTGANLY